NKAITKLLEKQNEEILKELEEVKDGENKIKKIIGIKPSKKTYSTNKDKKVSITSSRRGLEPAELEAKLKLIQEELKTAKKEQSSLKNHAIKYRTKKEKEKILKKLSAIPSRWPADGYVSSEYGWRTHPLYGGSHFHTGIDIIAPYGSSLYATASGVVIKSGYDGGYGYTVEIDHGNGYRTLYAHCSSILAGYGQRGDKGQAIARIGSSGTATGAHVHYEVKRSGERTNPRICMNKENTMYKAIAAKLNQIK
ncbi:MAG: M23 family metallopeptidase, partial [Armatimonadota bacterium]